MASPTASTIVRRALLYVPGSSQKMLAKSRTLTSDNVTYDLEDAVTPAAKPAARAALRSFLDTPRPATIREQAVRINAVSTGLAEADLREVLQAAHIDAVVVPKVQCAADLKFVEDAIRLAQPARQAGAASAAGPPVRIIALIESARAVMDLREICAASPLLSGLIFAAEDFALDLGLTRSPSLSEFLFARSAVVTAARAAGLPSAIDLVCTSFRGEHGAAQLEDECRGGRAMGFNGKQCIHPSQVEAAHRLFAPSQREAEWAVRCAVADEKAAAQGRGAWTLDGKMIDAPVSGLAKSILAKAEACGIDVPALREKWKDQEPE